MAIQFFSGTQSTLQPRDLADIYEYRHKIFIRTLGWNIPGASDTQEYDQFDTRETVYVVGRNERGHICAHARLLPTHRPYLLGDVFPFLMPDHDNPPPRDPRIWELSRYSTRDPDATIANTLHDGLDEWKCRGLLAECVRYAIRCGAQRMITTSPAGIARVMRNLNVSASKAGPLTRVDGDRHAIFAQWIDFDSRTLASLDLLPLGQTQAIAA